MTPRRVAVFTGNRAEYGLQYPILKAFSADARLKPFLLAGGSHLEEDFGKTAGEIEADGFEVFRPVEIAMPPGSPSATAQAIGTGVLSIAKIFDELRPNFLVVYGDRFESFAAVIAGTQMNIPTAHIEGGDYTEGGALDDSVRHAMTKLSHLHFATNDQAAERIRKLGEEPWRVFTVGLPALDVVAAGQFASPSETLSTLGFDRDSPKVLFCQHSVTTEFERASEQLRPSLEALRRLADDGYQIVATYPNNDAGGPSIIEGLSTLEEFPNVRVIKSLGRRRFHGLLNLIGREGRGCIAGNSSAGIKEATAFGCPAVNIGSRQQGRLRGDNVIDVPYDSAAIERAIRRCARDDEFRAQCAHCENPYSVGNAGSIIAEVLATIPVDRDLLRKKMTY